MKSENVLKCSPQTRFLRNDRIYSSLPTRFNMNDKDIKTNIIEENDKDHSICKTNLSLPKRKKTSNIETPLKMQRQSSQINNDNYELRSSQPYLVLNEFGMSKNLSTESVKNACEYFDDDTNEFSDNDFHETQRTPHAFRCKSISGAVHRFSKDSKSKKVATNEIKNCKVSISDLEDVNGTDNPSSFQKNEELTVLSELDSILDVHDTSEHNSDVNDCEYDKIEDCLMDLDTYLEEMDNNMKIEDNCEHNFNVFSNVTLPRYQGENSNKLKERSGKFGGFERRLSCSLEDIKDFSLPSLETLVSQPLNRAHLPSNLDDSSGTNKINQIKTCSELTDETEQTANISTISQTNVTNDAEMLTNEQILNNLLQNESNMMHQNRPRQFGRRAENENCQRMIAVQSVIVPRTINTSYCEILACSTQPRPVSAPAARTNNVNLDVTSFIDANRSFAMYVGSDASSVHSSRIPSPLTVASSSDSGSSEQNEPQLVDNDESPTICTQTILDPDNSIRRNKTSFNGSWPHSCSRGLAIFCSTLGLFNVSRFAILTVNYGGNFLLQFLLLSVTFGIPLLWLQMCLGCKIKAGPVSMWKISPICVGIGIALTLVQCLLAIYSTVPIAWVLVYLKDTFPSKLQIQGYRWQDTVYSFRHATHGAGNLTENIADYFNIIVLQRLQLANRSELGGMRFRVNDRLAFYLAFVWSIVFLILCKGLKSYGKVVLILATLPFISFVAVTCKLLYVADITKLQNIFSANDLEDFFINSKTWAAAAQEVFLTWGLLGASVISVTSRSQRFISKTTLRREAILIVMMTLFGLATAAIFGLCCIQLVKQNGFIYVPGSFERQETYSSVYSLRNTIAPELVSFPTKWLPHYSSFVGETYRRPETQAYRESGFQALRLITELLPATVSLSYKSISWIWTAVAFASFALMGISQLCVMWKPISSALGNSTSSVLLSCVTGLLLSIPFATEMGISILYYIEFLIGGSWILPVLWTALIFGVFLIRGRPYNGDDLVNDLYMSSSLSAFLALSWNVLLPIGLVALSVIDYKISLSSQFYYWRGKAYFSYWSRKVGSLMQIGFLLLLPIVAMIQIYRHLTNGPPDILDRIQNLYRPPEEGDESRRTQLRIQLQATRHQNSGDNASDRINQLHNDAPPKYTPPPSYTTATGARLAKMLRQSLRRSVRRILSDPNRSRSVVSHDTALGQNSPPDYLTILTNSNASTPETHASNTESIEIDQRPNNISTTMHRSLSLGRNIINKKKCWASSQNQRAASATISRSSTSSNARNYERPYTADDVVNVLRSSTRMRSTRDSTLPRVMPETLPQQSAIVAFRSIENLILNAEPPGQSAAVTQNNDGGQNINNCNSCNNTSVI